MKFDRVMVPVDGSPMSNVAVELALHSAGTFATHLTFVYVVDITAVNNFGDVDSNLNLFKLRTEGKLALEIVSKMADEKGVDYETVIKEGIPADVLIEMTKQQDMTIMSIAGKSGLGTGRIGSTARKVVENSFCPILTIKSGSNKIKDILLPVSKENMAAIDVAIETAKRIDGNITVMSIKSKKSENPQEMADHVMAHCKDGGVNATTYVAEGDPLDAIVGQSGKYDLVIMGVEKAGGLKKILHGGLTERVVTMASCPVTVVRDI